MFEHLGPELSAEVTWEKTDARLVGPLADLLRAGQWDVNKMAHYLPIYESAFGDRHRPVRMLEIGVNLGGSLEWWRDYFIHPDSVIVGIDYNEGCAQFADPDRNIHIRIGRQQDHEFLRSVIDEFGPFDIILDDGSHIPSFTLKSFQCLFPHLTVDGVYIVEDLHTCYSSGCSEPFPDDNPEFTGANDGSPQFIYFLAELMDVMHAHHFQIADGDGVDKLEPGNPVHQQSFQVPLATTIVKSIEVHDSIVVIRRGRNELTRMIRRWSHERMAMTRPPSDVKDFMDRRNSFLGEASRTRRDWISD